jgi:hypothetical protein
MPDDAKRGQKRGQKGAKKRDKAFQKPSVFISGNVADGQKNTQKDWVFWGRRVLLGPPEGRAGSQLHAFFVDKKIFWDDTTTGAK